jgi:predicted nucleic acid-binding protein
LRRIVSNATPLIYLAKIGKLDFLRNVFDEVIIPEEVRDEVVNRGKQLKHGDAFVIEKAIQEGWLKVRKSDLLESPIKLETGEMAVISLAKKLGIEHVLIDETLARAAASLSGLKARGTIFVLLRVLEEEEIDLDGFLDSMDRLIEQGFRLREEVYLQALRKARKIVGSKSG